MDIKIIGEPMPVAICTVSAGETLITEKGAMSWMTSNMKMDTGTNGGLGKAFGRMVSGESLFQNKYTATGGDGEIAFAATVMGSIRTYEVSPGRSIVAQKGSFLASTSGVDIEVHYKKKFGASAFGGEGFIMQKISGSGTVIVQIDGYAVDYDLAAGEELTIDTGHVAVMDESCTMDVRSVSGMKNMFLGGEGIFNTVVTGPGRVTLQTMPISRLATAIHPFLPQPTSAN
ncbi:MAG: TIGR00266 family protein [Eubacteriales bacterium]